MINIKERIIIGIIITIILLIIGFLTFNLFSKYKLLKTTVECNKTTNIKEANIVNTDKITIKADKEANVIKTEYIMIQKYAKKADYEAAKKANNKNTANITYKFNDSKKEVIIKTVSEGAIGVEGKTKVWLKSYVDLLKKTNYTCK